MAATAAWDSASAATAVAWRSQVGQEVATRRAKEVALFNEEPFSYV